jgi:hypothetical protein
MTIFNSPVRTTRESRKDVSAGDPFRTERPQFASPSASGSESHPLTFRLSLPREVLREIRSAILRIGEIRCRALDRRGVSLNPLQEIPLPPEEGESALACCIQDTSNLFAARPQTTQIDTELFLRGWYSGAASARRNWSTLPRV